MIATVNMAFDVTTKEVCLWQVSLQIKDAMLHDSRSIVRVLNDALAVPQIKSMFCIPDWISHWVFIKTSICTVLWSFAFSLS